MIIEDMDVIEQNTKAFGDIPVGTVFRGAAFPYGVIRGIYYKTSSCNIARLDGMGVYELRNHYQVSEYKELHAKLTIRNK